MDEEMRALVLAIVRNEEAGRDGRGGDRVLGMQGLQQLRGLPE